MKLQAPSAAAVARPIRLVPANTETKLLASAVPLMVGRPLRPPTFDIVGWAGAVASMSMSCGVARAATPAALVATASTRSRPSTLCVGRAALQVPLRLSWVMLVMLPVVAEPPVGVQV